MQLLLFLALAGVVSGLAVGGVAGGRDGMILGGSSGLVMGVIAWLFIGMILHAVREHRLNRHFSHD